MTSEYDSICGECEVVLTHSHREPRLLDLPTSIYEQVMNNVLYASETCVNGGSTLAHGEHSYYSQ